jgi:lipoprotein signal peptidase
MGRRSVIPGLMNLTHIENPGAAFGLLAGLLAEARRPLLIGLSLAAIAVLLYLYGPLRRTALPRLAIALILGRALGNLYERVLWGDSRHMDVFLGRTTGQRLTSPTRNHRGHGSPRCRLSGCVAAPKRRPKPRWN